MENYSGIFMLLVIAWAALATDKYFKLRRKYLDLRGYVMDCSPSVLMQTVNKYLTKFDDYQQIAADKGKADIMDYFVTAYNDLETYYFELKKGINLNQANRNNIRRIIKYSEKTAQVELY